MFPANSRYQNIKATSLIAADGSEIVYLKRRFLPPALAKDTPVEHTVTQGERLDNITASYLGDPLQFWKLCDANNAMHPDELTAEVGRRLRIPLYNGA